MAAPDLIIPAAEAQLLFTAANADAALLYLYLKAGRPCQDACGALGMSQARYALALAALEQLQLYTRQAPPREPPEPQPVTDGDMMRELAAGTEFSKLLGEVQRRFGRVLSTEEVRQLVRIYRSYGLAPEVITILINYCIQRQRQNNNPRMPSFRAIEREAAAWEREGVETMEQAAAYMQQRLLQQTQLGRIRQAFGIQDRRLTQSEETYIRRWLDWGFGEPEIAFAYDKTCLNTGGLRWAYLNSILESWHSQGLTTLAQIRAGDRPAAKPARTSRPGYRVQQHDGQLSPLQQAAVERLMNETEK